MRKWTVTLIGATILIWGIYDLFPLLNNTYGDTISEVIQSASFRWPVIAFAAGFVCGHFFWPINPYRDKSDGA